MWITKVIIKNEYAAGGSGSTKNKTGIKKILATRVNALVNKTLSLDFFKRIFHVTWHAAPDKIAKNKKLSNSYNPIKSWALFRLCKFPIKFFPLSPSKASETIKFHSLELPI